MPDPIVRIESINLRVSRPEIGIDARCEELVHPTPGWTWDEPVIRLHTQGGYMGWSWSEATQEEAGRVLGREVEELIEPGGGVKDEYRPLEFPLWDLLGRLKDQPVWRLMGGRQRLEGVPAYDTTLYFNDLLHDSPSDGMARIERDVQGAIDRGFRAVKIKLGRGRHQMSRPEGLLRDRMVVRRAREIAGHTVDLLVDADESYTLQEALDFADATGDLNLFWMEEMFPEELDAYKRLHQRLRFHGLPTLLADGETRTHEPIEFWEPYFKAGVIDVIQHDMRQLGFAGWAPLAEMAMNYWVRCAPTNWSSLIGAFLTLQFALVSPMVFCTEVATLESDVIDTSGYRLCNGRYLVPELPGLGLGLREEVYEAQYAGHEEWVISEEHFTPVGAYR